MVLRELLLIAFAMAAPIEGTVRAAESGEPVRHATVHIPALRRSVPVQPSGSFRITDVPAGQWRVEARALGYRPYSVTVDVPAQGTLRLELELEALPVPLDEVIVARQRTAVSGDRELAAQEVISGAVSLSRDEIRDLPSIGETDVLRTLQALPGVVVLNDLNAQLHVRGGGADQNLVLLDGARIFAPYHVFGAVGMANADAVERVAFYRGGLPARFGGALSSVIDLQQRAGEDGPVHLDGGVSRLATRGTAHGELGGGKLRWMASARRSYGHGVFPEALTSENRFPYEFSEAQGRVDLAPGAAHHLRASGFVSEDAFDIVTSGIPSLGSTWRNMAGSFEWAWAPSPVLALHTTGWTSGYRGAIRIGRGPDAPPSENEVAAGGLRVEARHVGGVRGGVELQRGEASTRGPDRDDAYVADSVTQAFTTPALFLDVDRTVGALRLSPGLRVVGGTAGRGVLVEPRLGARMRVRGAELTVNVGRSHQELSTIQDERQVVPGAPFWFVHPQGAPASRADALTVAVEGGLRGDAWSYSVGTYAKRFAGIPRWRPVGVRDFTSLEFVDGAARGAEFFLRRNAGRVTGWVGYAAGQALLTDPETGVEYDAPWDRRHSVDVALFYRPGWGITLSGQTTYGSGMPFWPISGWGPGRSFHPLERPAPESGPDLYPIYGDRPERYPDYFRIDLAARYEVERRGVRVAAVVGMQNLTQRPNVLYYRVEAERAQGLRAMLRPIAPTIGGTRPSAGLEIHF